MKKGIIGIVVLAFVLLFCMPTFAASIQGVTVDASIEWTIFDQTGLMPDATSNEPDLVIPELTIAAGAWEASTDGNYIKYTAEIGTVSLENSVGYGIFDLGEGIVEAQGVLLGTDLLSTSWDLVYTTNAEYGLGAKYDTGEFSVGAKYNSTGAYGIEVAVPISPITLTGQYAPGASAYLVKTEYTLDAGTITLQYKVASGPEVSVELADYPITATTLLKLAAVNAGGATDLSAEIVTTLVPGVKLTLSVANAAGAFTYSGVIGVTF